MFAMVLMLLLCFLLLFSAASAVKADAESNRMIVLSTIILLIEDPGSFGLEPPKPKRQQASARKRSRRTVLSIFNEMGPVYVRRVYRMDADSFWRLHKILRPHLERKEADRKKKHRDGAVNGLIPTSIRLSVDKSAFAFWVFRGL